MEDDYIKALEAEFPNAMRHVICGTDFGKGWLEQVRKAVKVLEAASCQVTQIKEKFGGLRIYYDYPEEINSWTKIATHMAVKQAEDASWKICELCGEPGRKRSRRWIRVLCDVCDAKEVKSKFP